MSRAKGQKDDYPGDVLDTHEMNRTLRHRLRNHCAGMKFTVDAIREDAGDLHAEVDSRCCLMAEELGRLLSFTERMDLLFDHLPAPTPRSVIEILKEGLVGFGRMFPWCDVEVQGPETDWNLDHGNWFGIALNELMMNAGEAAGRNGEVRILWQVDPCFAVTVIDVGSSWPERIPRSPPVPFYTTRGQHDGIGLAIAYRYSRAMGLEFEVMTQGPDVVAVQLSSPRGGRGAS